ncbi:hypothetical protein NZK32_14110 [Cyanobium sp. FGCU-52]|nr:hypothetical protein [Cyanobium sp. FGCU52]
MNDRLRLLQRQPRRITITLSYHVHEALLNRSEEEGRSVSNLCAFLLEESLRHPQALPAAPEGLGIERRQERHQGMHPGADGHLRQRRPG